MDDEWGKIVNQAIDYLAAKDKFDPTEVKSVRMILEVMESKNEKDRNHEKSQTLNDFIDPT